MMQELERVALTDDISEHGLKAGDIGMILHVYGEHKRYEVEFVTLQRFSCGSSYNQRINPLSGQQAYYG